MPAPAVQSFLSGGGAMGARVRRYDWEATPLGAPASWPHSLRTAVQILLTSRFAMWMAWGPELTFFCNDAYLPTTGIRRDWVLGARSDRVWSEIWSDIGPRIDRVLTTGEATWDEALPLYLERSGFPEETFHTFSYSPLADEAGSIAGMLCVVAEVSERVIGERQLAALRDVGTRLAATTTRADAMQAFEACLRAQPKDLPFALVWVGGECVASHGIDPTPNWPLDRVSQDGPTIVAVPPGALDGFALTHWQRPPHQALLVPIPGAEGGTTAGVLVAGLNPHRLPDAGYRGFIELVAAQLGAAIARADAFEGERARAEALAAIDRAKTAFFSNVSHEFRTPLTLMLGPLEDALAEPLPDLQRERVAFAHRNALRLLRLVNALLDFSRIETGRVEASYQPTDLAAFTADLASTFRSACERAGLRLEVDCPPLPGPVHVDREMWEKIVLNLLSNAFKFTLDGGIAVRLHARDGVAELAVEDTGTGIPAAALPRLFERFQRVEGARGRSFEGSGIGLALVQDLVGLHGGTVTVESAEGTGSTFRVRIPLGTAHLPPDRIRAGATASAATRARAFADEALRWLPEGDPDGDQVLRDAAEIPETAAAGALVLLADDNADLREYLRRLLAGRGYRVQVTADGLAALQAARAVRPDLLLTDVMMPGLDGFGLLAAIRADPALADIPVVMLSARAGEDAQVGGLEAGADDYLAKPFSARELLARVAANLDMARIRRDAAVALREMNASLEARIAEAVSERETALLRLADAQKLETLGQLTGGVAHDFNNLLTPVMGALDLMRRRHVDERSQRLIGAALQSAERAKTLIERLLAFARRQTLEPKAVDPATLLHGLRELLQRSLGPTIRVMIEAAPGLPPALVDPNQLELALLNLAVNARDAMEGGGTLTLTAAEADGAPGAPQGAYLRFEVRDTGTGMDAATLARAVEPFFSTKGVGKGTGLGLSMVHGLALQSAGAFHLASVEGEGTVATLFLPVAAEPAAEPAVARSNPLPAPRRATLLLVDDEDLVRATTAAMLEELGYAVAEAGSAAAAIAQVRAGLRPDLVVTDHLMPGMTGAGLATWLRQAVPGVPILMVTGYAGLAASEAPGIPVLPKPFAFADLAMRVATLLVPGSPRTA